MVPRRASVLAGRSLFQKSLIPVFASLGNGDNPCGIPVRRNDLLVTGTGTLKHVGYNRHLLSVAQAWTIIVSDHIAPMNCDRSEAGIRKSQLVWKSWSASF